VEQRLPDREDILVMEPDEEIGQYGGTLTSPALGTHQAHDEEYTRVQPLFLVSRDDFKTVIPNIAKGWDFSEDMKTLTIYLRKGMKWSDGEPYTADDIMFWYEDILLNEEITKVVPMVWRSGGEVMRAQKIDKYTIRFKFSKPYPGIMAVFASVTGSSGTITDALHCYPKHYLKKYHINYNPKANEIAKEEGYDLWWKCFQSHANYYRNTSDLNRPGIFAWEIEKITLTGDKQYVRNPYYWKVDTAGKQLPYIDWQYTVNVSNEEMQDLKLMSGELDFAGIFLAFDKYPLYTEGEKQGNYRTALLEGGLRGQTALAFNMCHKDPVLRKIFNDIRFRKALSLAMNREEMNEIIFQGINTPWQAGTSSDSSFVEEWMGKYCIEYDPQEANSLLDEMGLKWDKGHEYRLRSDGKPLTVNIIFIEAGLGWLSRVELIKEYWEKVGVKVNMKQAEWSYYQSLVQAGDHDFTVWVPAVEEVSLQTTGGDDFYPGMGTWWGSPWKLWFDTEGKSGEEPPEVVKKLHALISKFLVARPGSEEYLKLGKEISTIVVENLWALGDFGGGPSPVVINKNLRNTVFKKGDPWMYPYRRFWQVYCADQWFYKK